MIKEFEEYTSELNATEKEYAQALADIFNRRPMGKEHALTNQACGKLLWFHGASGAKIRKMIQYIRMNGLCLNLIAGSHGYYRSDNDQEVKDYIDGLVIRANAIQSLANQMDHLRKLCQKPEDAI
jgi:hypothetical protein